MGVSKSPTKCASVGIQGIAWAFGGMIFALVYCTAGISEKNYKSWRPNSSVTVFMPGESSATHEYSLKVLNLIGGKFVESKACVTTDVVNPATQEVVSQVPLTTNEELKAAVKAAKQAFPLWRNTPLTMRQHIMFKLHELIRRDIDKLAGKIVAEQGKTLEGARGDVLRGLGY